MSGPRIPPARAWSPPLRARSPGWIYVLASQSHPGILLVAGFPAACIRLQQLEVVAFRSGRLSRTTVPFSRGRKWRNVSAGERFRPN